MTFFAMVKFALLFASSTIASPTSIQLNQPYKRPSDISPRIASNTILNSIVGSLVSTRSKSLDVNTAPEVTEMFSERGSGDAPFSVSDSDLQAAISIPSGFSYGARAPPLILVPGTGSSAEENFSPNFGKLFTGTTYADPIYLNIPGDQLNDIQINAEYVAYAVKYISSVSGNEKVNLLTCSAGSICSAWALQYWPSIRSLVSDVISISGDYHGTTQASSAGFSLASAPAVLQQAYNSRFITTLRSGGGDSAYVPTTTIYSDADEVVKPQINPNASSFIKDARGVGVSNTQIQTACSGQAAGGAFSHEGMLYNPLAYALAVDALTHDGPGLLSRIDLDTVCDQSTSPGLKSSDVQATNNVNLMAASAIMMYPNKVSKEPRIQSYA